MIDIILNSCPNFNSLNDVKKLEWICNCENHNILTHLGVFLSKHCRLIFIFFIYLCLCLCLFFPLDILLLCLRHEVECHSYMMDISRSTVPWCLWLSSNTSLYIFVYYLTLEFCWGHEV